MSGLKIKQEWMQKTVVVWFGALLCCLLWGSAFPCIKIGYRLFEVRCSGYGIADSFLPAADSRWQEFWQLGLEV